MTLPRWARKIAGAKVIVLDYDVESDEPDYFRKVRNGIVEAVSADRIHLPDD